MKTIKFLTIIAFLSTNLLNAQTHKKRKAVVPPIITTTETKPNSIYYDFDKATLRMLSCEELANLVERMKNNPNLKVEISGYSDAKGDNAYNQKLSEDRVQVVVYRLLESGIDASRLTTKGCGETTPISANKKANGNDNPKGRQLNRRVELKVTESI